MRTACDLVTIAYIHRRPDRSYIAYMKHPVPAYPSGLSPSDNNAGRVRLTEYRTSPDGTKWSDLPDIPGPDWHDPADLQFMELCPHPVAEIMRRSERVRATMPEPVGGAYRETLERRDDKMPVASPPRSRARGGSCPPAGGAG